MWHTPTPIHDAIFTILTHHFFILIVSELYNNKLLDKHGSNTVSLYDPVLSNFAWVGLIIEIGGALSSYENTTFILVFSYD